MADGLKSAGKPAFMSELHGELVRPVSPATLLVMITNEKKKKTVCPACCDSRLMTVMTVEDGTKSEWQKSNRTSSSLLKGILKETRNDTAHSNNPKMGAET